MRLRELTDVSAAVAATRSRKAKTRGDRRAARRRRARRGGRRGRVPVRAADAAPDRRRLGAAARAAAARRRAVADRRRGRRRVRARSARCRAPAPRPRAARRWARCSRAPTRTSSAFLVRLLLGDLGQGALAGVMTAAVAHAAGVPEADVRRALTLHGDLAETARIALERGQRGPRRGAAGGRPAAVPDARRHRARRRRGAGEDRQRGGRAQARRRARADPPRRRGRSRVFTRTLDDVTAHVPEAVEAALALPAAASCSTAR